MTDLYFVSDLSIADDFGSAIEVRGGEILESVPVDLAARLLKRPDVRIAEPGMDVRRYSFDDPRRHAPTKALFIAPPIDPLKWAVDEKTKKDAFGAMTAQREKAQELARENRKNAEADVQARADSDARSQIEADKRQERAKAFAK